MRSYHLKFLAALLTLGLGVALAMRFFEPHTLPVPEPPCALCEGGGMWYHAPCVLDLSTGRLTELAIYAPHPSLVGEINPVQDWDYHVLRYGNDPIVFTVDRDRQACTAYVPRMTKQAEEAPFCAACRALLSAACDSGFVLLDAHDSERLCAYPLQDGAKYSFRGYDIAVTSDERSHCVRIEADLFLPPR